MYVDSYFHKSRFRRMKSGNDKTGMNVDGDRLSNLPDDVIHKILAFGDTKHAVCISSLSSRWRYIWTSLRDLNFSDKHFYTLEKFYKFVKGVLSGRNNQIEVHSVKLTLLRVDVSKAFFKRILNMILNYAVSHNVRQLNIMCPEYFIMTPSTWDLVALTTLNLGHAKLDDDKSAGLFSNFVSLKNLTLSYCRMGRPCDLNILCHPGLSNLTLDNGYGRVTVVTPQLKNLIIRNWERIHVTSAPNLASLQCEGHYYPLQLPADLLYLEKVDICIFRPSDVFTFSLDQTSDDNAKAHKIVCLFHQLHSVKFLTLNLEIIEILCSSVELISHQPSPFGNLQSLKIHRESYFTQKKQTQPKVTMCAEVENYLLGGSQGAAFTMVSHEDIRAMKKPKLVQNHLITTLQPSS